MAKRATTIVRWLLALALLALPAAPLASRQEKPAPELAVGATPEQARARLGTPARVSRQILAHRSVEQWHYGAPHNLRLVFDCPRGEVPRLVRSRPADPARRPE